MWNRIFKKKYKDDDSIHSSLTGAKAVTAVVKSDNEVPDARTVFTPKCRKKQTVTKPRPSSVGRGSGVGTGNRCDVLHDDISVGDKLQPVGYETSSPSSELNSKRRSAQSFGIKRLLSFGKGSVKRKANVTSTASQLENGNASKRHSDKELAAIKLKEESALYTDNRLANTTTMKSFRAPEVETRSVVTGGIELIHSASLDNLFDVIVMEDLERDRTHQKPSQLAAAACGQLDLLSGNKLRQKGIDDLTDASVWVHRDWNDEEDENNLIVDDHVVNVSKNVENVKSIGALLHSAAYSNKRSVISLPPPPPLSPPLPLCTVAKESETLLVVTKKVSPPRLKRRKKTISQNGVTICDNTDEFPIKGEIKLLPSQKPPEVSGPLSLVLPADRYPVGRRKWSVSSNDDDVLDDDNEQRGVCCPDANRIDNIVAKNILDGLNSYTEAHCNAHQLPITSDRLTIDQLSTKSVDMTDSTGSCFINKSNKKSSNFDSKHSNAVIPTTNTLMVCSFSKQKQEGLKSSNFPLSVAASATPDCGGSSCCSSSSRSTNTTKSSIQSSPDSFQSDDPDGKESGYVTLEDLQAQLARSSWSSGDERDECGKFLERDECGKFLERDERGKFLERDECDKFLPLSSRAERSKGEPQSQSFTKSDNIVDLGKVDAFIYPAPLNTGTGLLQGGMSPQGNSLVVSNLSGADDSSLLELTFTVKFESSIFNRRLVTQITSSPYHGDSDEPDGMKQSFPLPSIEYKLSDMVQAERYRTTVQDDRGNFVVGNSEKCRGAITVAMSGVKGASGMKDNMPIASLKGEYSPRMHQALYVERSDNNEPLVLNSQTSSKASFTPNSANRTALSDAKCVHCICGRTFDFKSPPIQITDSVYNRGSTKSEIKAGAEVFRDDPRMIQSASTSQNPTDPWADFNDSANDWDTGSLLGQFRNTEDDDGAYLPPLSERKSESDDVMRISTLSSTQKLCQRCAMQESITSTDSDVIQLSWAEDDNIDEGSFPILPCRVRKSSVRSSPRTPVITLTASKHRSTSTGSGFSREVSPATSLSRDGDVVKKNRRLMSSSSRENKENISVELHDWKKLSASPKPVRMTIKSN